MADLEQTAEIPAPEPLTDGQKQYANRFRDWLLMLSKQDFEIAVRNVLQPLKAAYYNRPENPAHLESKDVSRPS